MPDRPGFFRPPCLLFLSPRRLLSGILSLICIPLYTKIRKPLFFYYTIFHLNPIQALLLPCGFPAFSNNRPPRHYGISHPKRPEKPVIFITFTRYKRGLPEILKKQGPATAGALLPVPFINQAI
jgi:hypothetical protein